MPFDLPSLDTIHERLVADYRARLTEADVSANSDNWLRLRTLAKAALGIYYTQSIVYDDLMPDTAGGTALDRLANIWGLTRRGATGASKADSLRVYGTAASTQASGSTLTHPTNGYTYEITELATIPASPLYVDVDCAAVSTGSATQLESGQTLSFDSPSAGIETVAELQDDLDEDGQDQESDGELRTRLLEKIGQPGLGGAANDYKTWAIESDASIATAYVYPLRYGRGSVDLAALHAGSASVRLLDATERTALDTYVEDQRPVGVTFRVLEVTTEAENVDVTVTPRPGDSYKFDWDDTSGWQVLAWTAGTRTLQLDSNRPSDMVVGGRIVIRTAAGNGTGEQYTIESLGAGADEIVLSEAPSPAPVATDDVYAGGALTETIRDEIIDLFDALGPAVGDYGTGEWDDELIPERILAATLVLDGVRDATVVTPATTVTPDDPAYPNDDSIELLIPQEIVVREQH